MKISTPAFKGGAAIPKRHTGDGEDSSPALAWSEVPAGTKSLALVMDDPDAPPGTWIHWLVYDLPPGAAGLPEGVAKTQVIAGGARQGLVWGVDRFERIGYFGPLPPPGKPHRYFFKLYALDRMLGLPPGATKPELEKAMAGRVLAQAEVFGTYQR